MRLRGRIMSTRARKQPRGEGGSVTLKLVTATPTKRKSHTADVAREVEAAEAAAQAVAQQRLQGLDAPSMPWLRKGVDLTPPDGGPETCGPAIYKKPAARR